MATALRLFVASFVCLLATTIACGKDLFVDNRSGDDGNNGGSEQTTGAGTGPTRTIGRALLLSQKGDRIIIANTGEPYRECLTLQAGRNSGSDLYPFTIIGRGAVLDGTASIEDLDWENFRRDILRFRPRRGSFQTFYLGDQPAQRVPLAFEDLNKLEVRQWALIGGLIYHRVEPRQLPSAAFPRYGAHPVGITLYDVHNVQIFDLTVQGFQLDGVNAHDNVRQCNLINLSSNHNGRSGISIGGSCRVTLTDCSAAGNGVAQLRTEGFCRVEVEGGKFDPQSGTAIDKREGGKVLMVQDQ